MAYVACPKCGHTPLPADQAAPAACPGCGVIFAKIGMAPPPRRPRDDATAQAADAASTTAPDEVPEPAARERLAALLLYVPPEVAKTNWYARIGATVFFTLWTLWIWRETDVRTGELGGYILHMILTPFHEAGHYAIFRWFGQFIMTLGGTLGQHLFPIVVGYVLLTKNRDPFGAALFFWLLGYSVIDMGIYMYDAFDPKLGLLGGGTGAEQDGHDWQNIFGDLNLIRRAQGIGLFFGWVGKAMMVAGLAWAAWVVWLQKANLSDHVFAEVDLDNER